MSGPATPVLGTKLPGIAAMASSTHYRFQDAHGNQSQWISLLNYQCLEAMTQFMYVWTDLQRWHISVLRTLMLPQKELPIYTFDMSSRTMDSQMIFVSDRGPQFISKFTRRLLELCEIKGNRSTAYHPQSDGQTERMNQTLEQYLRIYCSYHQDDWSQLLPLAEFVYNNSKNVSTGASPFYANYGYHPRANLKVQLSTGVGNPAAEDLANRLRNVHKSLRSQLEAAQKTYKKKFDRHTKITPTFKPGDQVWLIRKNIKSTRPSQKFDTKRLGPFKILEVVGEAKAACKLDLPHQMRIHPVFHESLLEPYYTNKIEGRLQPPPPPPEVIEGEMEYEVKEILDSRIVRGKLKYLVDWLGYSPEERTWEPAEHLTNAPEARMAFQRDHPQRPSQSDIQKRPRRSSEPEKGGTVTNARSSDRRTDNRTRV